MTDPARQKRPPRSFNLVVRLATGLIAALVAGAAAHVFLNDPITTVVSALFFGLGAAISLGQGGGAGGDTGGGGFGDGGGGG